MTVENLSNASSAVASSYGAASEIWVGLAMALVLVLAIALTNTRAFKWLVGRFGTVALAVYYALHGLAGVGALAGFAYPFYWVSQLDGQTQGQIAIYGVGALVTFLGLSGFGYLVRHYFVEPIMENAREAGLVGEDR